MTRKSLRPAKVAAKAERTAARAGIKTSAEKRKAPSTFLTTEEAEKVVNPILQWYERTLKREGIVAVPGGKKRLSRSMLREECGFYGDTRTPLFKSLSYEQIAKKIVGLFRSNLKQVEKDYRTVPGFGEVLLDVESHQAEKISDRGHFPPASVWMPEKIDAIYKDKHLPSTFNPKAWAQTMTWLSSLWTGPKLDVTEESWRESFYSNPDKSSHSPLNPDSTSGFPDYVRKWFHRFKSQASDYQWLCQLLIISRTRALWKKFIHATTWKQCVLLLTGTAYQRTNVGSGWRKTKENTYKGQLMSKLRVVIGVDKRDTCLGKPILNRLIDICKQIRNADGTSMFSALMSQQVIDKTMQVMLSTAEKNGLTVLSTDFSGFDATINPYLMFEVAKAVSSWMSPRAANIFLGLVWSEFFNCRTIAPCGIWEAKPSSMKSGTIFTNILDSLYNLASQRYGVYAGFYEDILDHNVQGDDANIVGHGVNPKSFSECVSSLGLEGNEDKQYYEPKTLAFCQKIHILGYPGGIYPIGRCTASIVSTEDDFSWSPEKGEGENYSYVLAYRTVCRLVNSCFNPCFAQFVEMVAAEDRELHLGRSMPAKALAKAAGSYAETRERYYKDFPWKSFGSTKGGFERNPVNRVLRGELPPPPGIGLWEWVYETSYRELAI